MKKALIVLSGTLAVAGCRLPLQPLPGPGREGMLYCYTKDYSERYLPFCLLGKSLVASKGDGSWEIIPPPTAFFPGIPLYLAEQYAICPAVDTIMIPYDLAVKARNESVCAKDGPFVRLTDRSGRPMAGVEIDITIDAESGRRIVYGGEVQKPGCFAACTATDAEGKAYIPVKLSSCRKVRFSGWAMTTKGLESFDGSVDSMYEYGWTRVGRDESCMVKWGAPPSRGSWLKRLAGKSDRPDGGKRAEGGDVKMLGIRLKGDQTETDISGQPEIIYADGTSKSEYLNRLGCTIGSEVMRQMHAGEMPDRADDFDAYWDGAAEAMRSLWRGEPVVEELPGLSGASNKAYRVTFDVGSRLVEGILFEPEGRATGATPVIAFAGQGPNPGMENLYRPADRAILHLSVFEPGYEYHRGEFDIREKYRLSQYAFGKMYAIDGIDKGRESYFFYPVISGALRASEWLSARENASGVKCIGTDQGAALALTTAALGGRVAEVAAHHPEFVGVADWPNAWPKFDWHERSGLIGEVRKWIPYFELTSFAGRVTCPVTMLLNPKEMPDCRRADGTITVFKALPGKLDKRLVVDTSVSADNVFGRLVDIQRHRNP